MSSNVVVISTDFRRATIKVTPATYLIDVLEEACRKFGLSSEKFLLKHNTKQLELSNQLRAYNLSPGAKLELVVRSNSPSVVSVALKLPDSDAAGIPNGRLIDKFRSDTTLWKMLRHFESGAAPTAAGRRFNFTARGVPQTSTDGQLSGAGQLYYEGPMLLIMGRELSSLSDLQKTLSQVGISGNVLITMSFRLSGLTLHEAMQQMEQFFAEPAADGAVGSSKATEKQPDAEPKTTVTTSAEESSTNSEAPLTDEKMAGTEAAPQPEPTTATSHTPASLPDSSTSGRAMQVFSAPSASTPAAALTKDPESAFQPTIVHAQLHQQRLQANSVNKRLPSDREIEAKAAADAAKLAAIKEVSIKVRFPDNTSAQWTFGPDDTAASLYAEVRNVMADPAQPFKLASPAVKGNTGGVLRDATGDAHSLIRGYRLEGRVVANLLWADEVPPAVRRAPFLKGSVASQARDIPVPVVATTPDVEEEAPVPSKPAKNGGEGGSGVKMPKWLKLPGKK